MKYSTTFLIILIMGSISPILSAENGAYTISGLVQSRENGKSLAGVNIYIAGTSIGVTSGTNGHFKLPALPRGKYIIRFNYIKITIEYF